MRRAYVLHQGVFVTFNFRFALGGLDQIGTSVACKIGVASQFRFCERANCGRSVRSLCHNDGFMIVRGANSFVEIGLVCLVVSNLFFFFNSRV